MNVGKTWPLTIDGINLDFTGEQENEFRINYTCNKCGWEYVKIEHRWASEHNSKFRESVTFHSDRCK